MGTFVVAGLSLDVVSLVIGVAVGFVIGYGIGYIKMMTMGMT